MVEQFHSQLTRSQQTLGQLQEKLQAGLQNIRKDPKAVPDQLKHLSEQVLGELERLSSFVLEKRKDLVQCSMSFLELDNSLLTDGLISCSN
jgi:type II secretory pathway predicted ATPase ExeA